MNDQEKLPLGTRWRLQYHLDRMRQARKRRSASSQQQPVSLKVAAQCSTPESAGEQRLPLGSRWLKWHFHRAQRDRALPSAVEGSSDSTTKASTASSSLGAATSLCSPVSAPPSDGAAGRGGAKPDGSRRIFGNRKTRRRRWSSKLWGTTQSLHYCSVAGRMAAQDEAATARSCRSRNFGGSPGVLRSRAQAAAAFLMKVMGVVGLRAMCPRATWPVVRILFLSGLPHLRLRKPLALAFGKAVRPFPFFLQVCSIPVRAGIGTLRALHCFSFPLVAVEAVCIASSFTEQCSSPASKHRPGATRLWDSPFQEAFFRDDKGGPWHPGTQVAGAMGEDQQSAILDLYMAHQWSRSAEGGGGQVLDGAVNIFTTAMHKYEHELELKPQGCAKTQPAQAWHAVPAIDEGLLCSEEGTEVAWVSSKGCSLSLPSNTRENAASPAPATATCAPAESGGGLSEVEYSADLGEQQPSLSGGETLPVVASGLQEQGDCSVPPVNLQTQGREKLPLDAQWGHYASSEASCSVPSSPCSSAGSESTSGRPLSAYEPSIRERRKRRHEHKDQGYLPLEELHAEPWKGLVYWHGRDRWGRPTLCIRLGAAVRILPKSQLERIADVIISHVEHAECSMLAEDERHGACAGLPHELNLIVDTEGLGVLRRPPMDKIQRVGFLLNRDYPGRGGTIFLVNPPVVLGIVLKALHHALVPKPGTDGTQDRGFLESQSSVVLVNRRQRDLIQAEYDDGMLQEDHGGACPCARAKMEKCPRQVEFYNLSTNSSAAVFEPPLASLQAQ